MKIKQLLTVVIVLVILGSCSESYVEFSGDSIGNTAEIVEGPVSVKEAKKRLQTFLNINTFTRGSAPKTIVSVAPVRFSDYDDVPSGMPRNDVGTNVSGGDSAINNPDTYAYVFNFDNEGGFAIMSANDKLPELIAISENGNLNRADYIQGEYDETAKNPGIVMFMDCLHEYATITLTAPNDDDDLGGGQPSVSYGVWSNVYPVGYGFCSVKWHQNSPYNMFCGTSGGDQNLAGCGPVAMALFLACHQFPTNWNGYSFPWPQMLSGNSNLNVARLIEILGRDENMDVSYGASSSGCNAANSTRTFKNLGFSEWGRHAGYKKDTVRNELLRGYPVLGSGHRNLYKGHVWLIHGLLDRYRDVYSNGQSIDRERESYVLCNWGWGGLHDGYFLNKVFHASAGPDYPESVPTNNVKKNDRDFDYKYRLHADWGVRI